MSVDATLVRALRRFTLGRGPLKRGADRLECLSRVLVVLVVCLAVPVALAVGTATWTEQRDVAIQQSATRYVVTATLVGELPTTYTPGQSRVVEATWEAADGVLRQGRVAVPPGALAGQAVPIWLDGAGSPVREPLTEEEVACGAVLAAVLTFLGIAAVAGGVHLLAVVLLDRYRAHRWAAEWAIVEPQWIGRLH